MLTLFNALEVAYTNYQDEPLQYAFLSDQGNYTISLGRKRLYLSLLPLEQRRALREARRENAHESGKLSYRLAPGFYRLKLGAREFALLLNYWPKKSRLEKRTGKARPLTSTGHTLRALNTEFFLGRHSLVVSTLR